MKDFIGNGGVEEINPLPSTSSESISPNSTKILPWSVIETTKVLSTETFSPRAGAYSIMPGKISQTIKTISGLKYTLSFFIAAFNGPNNQVSLDITIGGSLTTLTYQSDIDWEFRYFEFIATSASTQIIFSSSLNGPVLDEITLTLSSIFSSFLFFFLFHLIIYQSKSFPLFLSFFVLLLLQT